MGDFKVLVTPDHPTPLSLKTHTNDPVPYMIYDSRQKKKGTDSYNEKTAKSTGIYISEGYTLMKNFLK